jgi:phenylacetate-CoA ligase
VYISLFIPLEYSEGNLRGEAVNMKNNATKTNLMKTTTFSDPHGEKMALDLFHKMAERVPAYKKFLGEHHIDHTAIKTYEEFVKNVPVIDKQNYLSQHPIADLCMDGDVFHNAMISVSSGSTGIPFFWPRGAEQDKVDSEMLARIYDAFGMNTKKTLLVLSFSMGTWIAGTLLMESSINYANAGNPVSVLTPGVEKMNAIDVIKRLAGQYEQVVIGGYPPFAKDLIEEGQRAGIDWSKLHTRVLMGGEGFSEEWRDYVLELLHSADPYFSSANIYGAADIGIVGYETPLSILARRTYNENPTALYEHFGTEVLPSLVQFDPAHRHFEKVGDELVVSSNSGIPLVRYNLKDTGGILSRDEILLPVYETLRQKADETGVDLEMNDLPFVYLNGRKDFVITVYGVNIYPENIKASLIDPRLRQLVTGRFTMATMMDDRMDQSFEINVELAKDAVATIDDQDKVTDIIVETLTRLNSEYRKLYEVVSNRARPQVRLVGFGDQNYFARGVKHRWTKKKEQE